MTIAQTILAAYLVFINAAAFALYALDKRRAKRRMWRVRESTLLTFTVLGGSLGSLLAMHLLRHKTLHGKFYAVISTSFFLHTFLFAYLFWKFS